MNALPGLLAPTAAGPFRAESRWAHAGRVAFVLFAVLLMVNAFYWWFQGAPAGTVSDSRAQVPSNRGNLIYVGSWLILYGISGLLVLRGWWRRGVERRFLLLVPLAAYVLASASWAYTPSASLVPAAMLSLDIVIAAALAGIAHPRDVLRWTASLNVALAALSLVLMVTVPQSVFSDPQRPGILTSGELFGAYGSKLGLALSGSMSIIVITFLPVGAGRPIWRWLSVGVLGLAVILSNSASSATAGMVGFVTIAAARRFPRHRVPIFVIVSVLAAAHAILLPFINVGAIAELLGRSADLTGRGTFWPQAPGFISQRLLFGYGYMGFFDTTPYSKAWDLWATEQYFFTPEFHNTILDLSIGLGLVGVLGYLTVLATGISIAAHPTLDRRSVDVLSGCLIMFIMGTASEFSFLAHNGLATIFLFYVFLIGGRRYPGDRSATARNPGVSRHAEKVRWTGGVAEIS